MIIPDSMYAANPSMRRAAKEVASRKMCRFCLRDSVSFVNFNVKPKFEPFDCWLQKVALVFPSPALDSNCVPKYVCVECHKFVERCCEFRKLCKQAEQLLISYPLTGIWTDRLELPEWLKTTQKRPSKSVAAKRSSPKRHCSDISMVDKSGDRTASSQVGSIRVRSNESLTVPSTLQSPTISSENPVTAPTAEVPIVKIMANLVSSLPVNPPVSLSSMEITTLDTTAPSNYTATMQQIQRPNSSPPEPQPQSSNMAFNKPISQLYQQSLQDLLTQPSKPPSQNINNIYQYLAPNINGNQQLPSNQPSFEHQQNLVQQTQQQPPPAYPPQLQQYSVQQPAANFSSVAPQQQQQQQQLFEPTAANNYQQQSQQLPQLQLTEHQQQPQQQQADQQPLQHLSMQLPMQYVPNVMPVTAGPSTDQPEPSAVIQCNACSQQFLHPGHLNLHMRKHTGRALFNCGCGQRFSTLTNFVVHLRNYPGLRWCCLCQEQFEDTWQFSQHLEHHIKLGYGQSCDFCSLIFTSKEQRTEHVRRNHRQDMRQIMQLKMGRISVKLIK